MGSLEECLIETWDVLKSDPGVVAAALTSLIETWDVLKWEMSDLAATITRV